MKNIKPLIIFYTILLSGCGVSEEEYLKFHGSGVADSTSLNQAECLEAAVTKTNYVPLWSVL